MEGGGGGPNPIPLPSATQIPSVPTVAQFGRMKFFWRALLISNFALGAYLFAVPKNKQIKEDRSKTVEEPPTPVEMTVPVHEEVVFLPPMPEPIKVPEPIPEDQQREIFNWILEEKRKAKPQNREEKKRINEDKATLKQFIRKESIPDI